jgi:hypothetical protein
MPSCIRAPPPEPLTKMSGSFISVARSAARASFSPTTLPMLPAMNAKSVMPSTTGRPRMNPLPVTAASSIPVFACSSASR